MYILICFAGMGSTRGFLCAACKGQPWFLLLQAVFALCSQVGHYKRVVKRVDDGHRLCNDLMGCLQERAKIEKAYGDQLTAWSKRWRQLIEKGQILGSE